MNESRWSRRMAGVLLMTVDLLMLMGAIMCAVSVGATVFIAMAMKGRATAAVLGLLAANTAYWAGVVGRRAAVMKLAEFLLGPLD